MCQNRKLFRTGLAHCWTVFLKHLHWEHPLLRGKICLMQNVLTVDNEVNEVTFGLDLPAVGPRTALLPQFFQDQPLRVQKCKSSQPDGWESTSVEFKGICNTCFCGGTPPTGKLWIT